MKKKDAAALENQLRMDDMLQAVLSTVRGAQMQGAQLSFGTRDNMLTRDGYVQLSRIYEGDGLFSSVNDRAAEDAMAAGFEFHRDASQELKDEFERLELDEIFTDALRFARLHGGAIILPMFRGNASLANPISRNRTWQIESFDVISIDRITVDSYGTDGMPEIYNVESLVNKDQGTFKLHASRCIYVAGRRRPYRQTDTELIWPGVSEGQRCMKEVLSLSRAFVWAEKALERKSQPVYKMKGLAQALQNKMQDVVTKRLDMVDATRSLLNTVAIDSEDEYEISDTNLASISDTLDSKMQAVSAITGYPITVLFGRRTTSLNSKGDSDTDTYYRMLNKIRRNMLRSPLAEVVELMSLYVDTTAPKGETVVQIAKLDALSEYEESEIEERKSKSFLARAQAIAVLTKESAAPQTNAAPKPGEKATKQPAARPTPSPTASILTPEEIRTFLLNEEPTE